MINAGFWSSAVGAGNVKCDEMARDRRCVWRDRLPAIEGVDVKESGDAGGDVGKGIVNGGDV